MAVFAFHNVKKKKESFKSEITPRLIDPQGQYFASLFPTFQSVAFPSVLTPKEKGKENTLGSLGPVPN